MKFCSRLVKAMIDLLAPLTVAGIGIAILYCATRRPSGLENDEHYAHLESMCEQIYATESARRGIDPPIVKALRHTLAVAAEELDDEYRATKSGLFGRITAEHREILGAARLLLRLHERFDEIAESVREAG